MIKKNKGIYTKIPHLRRFVLQNFPFIEEDFDALTDYELLCKVVEYLNTVITSQNALIGKVEELEALFNQLKDFVDHYFDNLDVQEEINNKIEEMAESGELANVILTPLSKELKGEYLMTRYFHCANEDNTEYVTTNPCEQEGICYVGNNRIVNFYSGVFDGVGSQSESLLEEFDLSNKTSPIKYRTKTYTGLMHVNSACFDGDKIYVAPSVYYTEIGGTSVPVHQIGIIDYDSLELEDIVEIDGVNQISYISYYNGNLYSYDHSSKTLYKVDLENKSVESVVTLDNYTGSIQGAEIRNNRIYLMQPYPYRILCFDLSTGKYIKQYGISPFDNEGHSYDYCADFTFIDDENLILTPHVGGDYVNESSEYAWTYYVNYYIKVNIFGNNLTSPTSPEIYNIKRLYVDTTPIETIETTYYAIGSSSKPLRLISEYMRNYYKLVMNYEMRTRDSQMVYYGVCKIINDSLRVPTSCSFGGIYLINANLACNQIELRTSRVYMRGSTLSGSSIWSYYNGEDSSIEYSSLLVPDIKYASDNSNMKLELRGSVVNRFNSTYTVYNTMQGANIEASVSVSGTTLTADFSNRVSSTNFDPVSYLLCINILPRGESIVFPRMYRFGNSRRFFDKDGNEYTVTTYDKTTKKITITGNNVNNINTVGMITI